MITIAIVTSVPLIKLPILIKDTATYEGKHSKINWQILISGYSLDDTKRTIPPKYIPFKYILGAFSFPLQY